MSDIKIRWIAPARDAFDGIPDATLVQYVLPEAAKALMKSDPDRARSLLRSGRKKWDKIRSRLTLRNRLSLATASAYVGYAEGVEVFTKNTGPRGDILKRLFAEQARTAQKLGVNADYASVRAATHEGGGDGRSVNKAERGGEHGKSNQRGSLHGPLSLLPCVQIGLLDYRNPVNPSINLGNYIQTIAVIGQLSRFSFDSLEAPEAVCDMLAQGHTREGEAAVAVGSPVEVVPVSRDYPLSAATVDGLIWLPVFGWFGHKAYPEQFDFPFPNNIRPLFLALHIANPNILTEETQDYLRRFEPIGCRDLFTARLLRGAGVKAFFNGCITMTLDRLHPPHAGERISRYDTFSPRAKGYKCASHSDPACLTRDFDGNLRAAMGLLDQYHTAADVRTERLQCYLPCRAMGVPVTLTKVKHSDPRFYGLTDLDEGAFRDMALRFEAIAQPVLAAILEGRSEAEVYALWRKVTAPAMTYTDALIEERNAKYPLQDIRLESLELDRIPVQAFSLASDPDGNAVHLLFAFDENFAEHFPGTFEGVWRHATRPLVVHVFGRGLNAAMFERWVAQFRRLEGGQEEIGVRFVWQDLSSITYGDVNLLPNITIATMDRLLAPALLPDVEKIIYLDVDILVRKDIADLFNLDLNSAPLAGNYHDPYGYIKTGANFLYTEMFSETERGRHAREAFRNAFFSGGSTVFEGFNAGVLVMNLAAMRRDRMVEKTLALAVACGRDDQVALNLYARERRMPMPLEWNHRAFFKLQQGPAIVHFTGPKKPWTKGPTVALWSKLITNWMYRDGIDRFQACRYEWRENARRARDRRR